MEAHKRFSTKLVQWLGNGKPKTFDDLLSTFGHNAFATCFLILMFLPAMPIPTGGITHLFLQPVTFLVAIQMFCGRRTVWLPKRIRRKPLGKLFEKDALPFMTRCIHWFEKYSRPRKGPWLDYWFSRSGIAFIVMVFTFASFISPPFSGLDTLPSLGVVVISLGLLLEDLALIVGGTIIGSLGLALIFASGAAISAVFSHLF